jgi:hypothetical protein
MRALFMRETNDGKINENDEKIRHLKTYPRRPRLPGDNPTIASYNASVVNFYNAKGSLVCFKNKHIFFYFEKRSSLPQSWLLK